MIAPLLIALAAASAFVARRRRRRQHPAHAVIVSPRQSTVIQRDGAVRSVQSAELTIDERDMEDLWTPANLENLARTYWRFLSRVTLGLIRVAYDTDSRSVVTVICPAAVDTWAGVATHFLGDVARLARVKNAALGAQATRMMSSVQTSIFNMPQLTLRTGMLAVPVILNAN